MSPTSESWNNLMRKAQDGDSSAYTRLLREICPVLRGYIARRVYNDRDTREDLLQEILLALHKVRHTWRPEMPFENWMFGIAQHKIIDMIRSKTRKPEEELPDEELETFLTPQTNTPEEGTVFDLKKAMDSLPLKQREIVMMIKIEGYSMAEAAEKLGMTSTAVKVTAHRACLRLEKWLVQNGY